MERSNFVTDSEITSYINQSVAELYDLLITEFEDYYIADPVIFTISNNATTQLLPTDFYKLRGLDFNLNGLSEDGWTNVDQFNFNERNLHKRCAVGSNVQRYRLMGNKLILSPVGYTNGNYRLWYIPQAPKLVASSDELDVVNGWEEYVIVDAAIKCLQKEESDVSVLALQKSALIKRIQDSAANRDAGSPGTITDVYQSNSIISNRRLF